MAGMHLSYGKGFVTVSDRKGAKVEVIEAPKQPGIPNLVQDVVEALSYRCVGTPGLYQMVRPEDRFTIVVRGPSHLWMGQYALIPSIVYYLNQLGVATKQIALVVGSATESRVDLKELDTVVHPEIRREMEIVSCHNPESRDMQDVGTIKGVRVRLNTLLTKRKVILLDGVRPHPHFVFTGGGMPILQACAWETAQNFMRLAVHRERQALADGMMSGRLEENPLTQFLKEVGELISPFFGIYVIPNNKNEPYKVFCGHWWDSFAAACGEFYPLLGTKVERQYEAVLASAGGAPYDDSYYRSLSGLLHAAHMTVPGGKIFFVAQCPNGGPDQFLAPLQGAKDVEALYHQIRNAPQSLDDLALLQAALLAPSYQLSIQTKLGMRELPFPNLRLYRTMETMEAQIPYDECTIGVLPSANRTYPYL